MTPPTVEARAFVQQHVAVFSERHWKKLHEIYPARSVQELLKDSGHDHIVQAMSNLDDLDNELQAVMAKRDEAIRQYNAEFGPVIKKIMIDDDNDRTEFLKEKQDKFDHKLRGAIGLMELVSTKKAYELLESCREKIRCMTVE